MGSRPVNVFAVLAKRAEQYTCVFNEQSGNCSGAEVSLWEVTVTPE